MASNKWLKLYNKTGIRSGSAQWDAISEIAIEILSDAGYTPDDSDDTGDPIDNHLQSALMEAMIRSRKLTRHLSALQESFGKSVATEYPWGECLMLDAFNLAPGLTFATLPDDHDVTWQTWTVMHVDRTETEQVVVMARLSNNADSNRRKIFLFDYCDKIALIGNVINPDDIDDNNWGTN